MYLSAVSFIDFNHYNYALINYQKHSHNKEINKLLLNITVVS